MTGGLWREALEAGLRWNGFRRVDLTADQRMVLARYLADDEPV